MTFTVSVPNFHETETRDLCLLRIPDPKCLLFYVTQFRMICSVAIVSEIDFDIWKWGAAKIKPKTYSIDFGTGWLVKTCKALRRLLVRD